MKTKMLVIGLTGNLASGKTAVSKMFQELGAKVLDADRIAHRLLKRGSLCFKPVVRHFGEDILAGGEIDRGKLAGIVFNDEKKLQALNKIIHPKVIQEIRKEIFTTSKSNQTHDSPSPSTEKNKMKAIVVEAALLIESGLNVLADVVVVVKANRRLQIQRAVERMKISPAEALRRIKMQRDIKEKLKYADIVIDNRGDLNLTKKQVEDIWQRLTQRKTAK